MRMIRLLRKKNPAPQYFWLATIVLLVGCIAFVAADELNTTTVENSTETDTGSGDVVNNSTASAVSNTTETGNSGSTANTTLQENSASTNTTIPALPTITSITPNNGINNGLIRDVVVSGSGYSSFTTVTLVRAGQQNITMSSPKFTTTTITGDFALKGALPGTWDVVLLADGGSVTKSSGFAVINESEAASVTGITPSAGTTNTTVIITSLTGSGFRDNARMRLTRSGYNDVLGLVTCTTSTQMTGSFDLTSVAPGSYLTTVLFDGTKPVYGPVFTVTAAATAVTNGSVYFESSPSNAAVYVESAKKGTTPFTLYNVTPGSYAIKIQKTAYLDWGDRITVTSGNQTKVSAKLTSENAGSALQSTQTAVPVAVTTATLPPAAKKTQLAPVLTPWPTETPQSPLAAYCTLIALGIGAGIILLRKW
jgi:hypothetical protein